MSDRELKEGGGKRGGEGNEFEGNCIETGPKATAFPISANKQMVKY